MGPRSLFYIFPDSWPFFPVGKKRRIFYYSKGIVKSIGVGKNPSFFFQKKDRKRKIEDRSEKSMLFSERSSIFLFALCRRKSLAIFDGRGASPPIPGPLRFTARRANLMNGFAGACLKFFLPTHEMGRRKTRESEGTAVLPIPGPLRFQSNLRGRPFFRFACFFPLPLRSRGKKNLRHAPANPFMRFARRAVNRKERQDFIPSAPQGQRKKTRESERKARFYSLCPAGAEEKNTRIGGDTFSLIPRAVFPDPFHGSEKNTGFPPISILFPLPIFPPTPSEFGENPSFF